jgi:hypothetical protein
LAEYAEEIGIAFETLRGYRAVSAAWEHGARGTMLGWTTHRALMGEPDRAELIGSREWTAEALAIGAVYT